MERVEGGAGGEVRRLAAGGRRPLARRVRPHACRTRETVDLVRADSVWELRRAPVRVCNHVLLQPQPRVAHPLAWHNEARAVRVRGHALRNHRLLLAEPRQRVSIVQVNLGQQHESLLVRKPSVRLSRAGRCCVGCVACGVCHSREQAEASRHAAQLWSHPRPFQPSGEARARR